MPLTLFAKIKFSENFRIYSIRRDDCQTKKTTMLKAKTRNYPQNTHRCRTDSIHVHMERRGAGVCVCGGDWGKNSLLLTS